MKDFLGQGNLKLVSKQLENPECAEEWNNVLSEIESSEWAGIIIGDKYFPENTIFTRISTIQSKRSFEVFIFSDITQLLPRLSTLENNKLIKLNRPLLVGRYAFIKRFVDVVFSFLALIILSPVFILTAVLVKVTSKGPVLYIDKRIGKDNKLFYFPKFRSMYKDADKVRNQILGSPDAEMPERYKADPRITPFGKFIRRWSIDELPQIYCVLIGTMSLVGPRPILREEDTDVPLESRGRFLAKPGLTGLWQVSGRKEVLWNNRMNQDLLYIESWTLLNDFLLIIKTIGTIISGRGAV
jgi:lipopolysaccharide/colanic/teichoic acid biosynthesis glycosyltransferase